MQIWIIKSTQKIERRIVTFFHSGKDHKIVINKSFEERDLPRFLKNGQEIEALFPLDRLLGWFRADGIKLGALGAPRYVVRARRVSRRRSLVRIVGRQRQVTVLIRRALVDRGRSRTRRTRLLLDLRTLQTELIADRAVILRQEGQIELKSAVVERRRVAGRGGHRLRHLRKKDGIQDRIDCLYTFRSRAIRLQKKCREEKAPSRVSRRGQGWSIREQLGFDYKRLMLAIRARLWFCGSGPVIANAYIMDEPARDNVVQARGRKNAREGNAGDLCSMKSYSIILHCNHVVEHINHTYMYIFAHKIAYHDYYRGNRLL